MRTFHTLSLGIIGIASGMFAAVATDVLANYYLWHDAMRYTPGIVFGVFVSLYLLMQREKESTLFFRLPLWIVGSTASYFIAFKTVELLAGGYGAPGYGEFLIAGAAGGIAMLLCYSILIFGLELKEIGVLVVLAAALGLGWFAGTSDGRFWTQPLFALLVIWQGGMGFGLGIAMDRRH